MQSLETIDQIEAPAELYEGIGEYFEANKEWLPEVGYDDAQSLNSAVDSQYESYLAQIEERNRMLPEEPLEIKYSSPASYAGQFMSHMVRNEARYKQHATKLREEREALEQANTVDKAVRMQRVEDVMKKTERITDVFKGLDIEGIDPNKIQVDYWLTSPFDLQYSRYKVGDAVKRPIDKEDVTTTLYDAVKHVDKNRSSGVLRKTLFSDTLLVSRHDTFDTHFMNVSALPVGAYGIEATQKIAQAVDAVGEFLKQHEEHFKELHEEFGHTLVRSQDNSNGESVPMLSLYEGVMTIAQALNALIQEKVNGYESADELIKDLVVQGVLLKFARTFTQVGLIGPISLTGRYIPSLVTAEEHSSGRKRLKLSRDYLDEQAKIRKAHLIKNSGRVAASVLNGDVADTERLETVLSLEGCPATHSSYDKETGESRNVASEVTRVFLEVYNRVDTTKLPEPTQIL